MVPPFVKVIRSEECCYDPKPLLHQRQQHPQQHQRHQQHPETSRCSCETLTPSGSGTSRTHRQQIGQKAAASRPDLSFKTLCRRVRSTSAQISHNPHYYILLPFASCILTHIPVDFLVVSEVIYLPRIPLESIIV